MPLDSSLRQGPKVLLTFLIASAGRSPCRLAETAVSPGRLPPVGFFTVLGARLGTASLGDNYAIDEQLKLLTGFSAPHSSTGLPSYPSVFSMGKRAMRLELTTSSLGS